MFGLSFANPVLLHGLWAALLPLIIHLLNRRRITTVTFSNVALLQALQHDRMRRVKLKQILLLILRTLLIVVLVLAFARPTMRGASGAVGDAGTAAVILLDRSLSMQYRTPDGTLYDRALQRVRTLLSLFSERDDVHVLLVDEGVEEVPVSDAERLRLHLDALRPGFGGTDFQGAIAQALQILTASQMPNRELYFVTDLARNGWVNTPDTLEGVNGISVHIISERPGSVANLGITQIKTVGSSPQVGRPTTLEIELLNYGDAPRADVPVQAFLNDRRIAQQIAHVPAKRRQKFHTRFVPETGGPVALRVEIGDDDLEADNQRVTVLPIPEQVRVLLVSDVAQEAYYLTQALSVAEYEIHQVRSDAVSEAMLERMDAVFLCNVSQLPLSAITALQNRMSAGLGLAIFLGDRVDIRHYNERLLPALFPATLMGVRGTPGERGAYRALQANLPDHVMLADLELDGVFQSPRFFVFYRVQGSDQIQPVLSFASGEGALFEFRGHSGRALLFASSFGTTLEWNDVPLSGFFLPFVHRLTGYLAAGAFGRSDYRVGQMVYRDMRTKDLREAVLRPPGSESRTIWPEQRGLQSVWPVGRVDAPGLWEIYAREQLADRFAVQIDVAEPDLTPVPLGRLKALFGERVHVVDGEADLREAVLSLRHGKELWRSFLWGALLLMAGELLIARSTRTSRGEEKGDSTHRSSLQRSEAE